MARFSISGFNNEKILLEYIDKVIKPYQAKNMFKDKKKLVLLMDDVGFHKTDSIKKKLKESEIDLIIIPGGTTSILQPLDVVVNKPPKDYLRKQYLPWLENQTRTDESIIKTGEKKAPRSRLF